MANDFSTWLRSLEAERLADVLRHRPDATAVPVPATIEELAQRLAQRQSVLRAVRDADAAMLGLAEIVFGFGSVTREELGETLPRVPAPVLDHLLARLQAHALVWCTDGGALRAAGGLSGLWPHPLGLGEPLRTVLGRLAAGTVAEIADTLGVPWQRSPSETHCAIVAHLTPERIRSIVASAPSGALALLEPILTGAPLIEIEPWLASQLSTLGRNRQPHPVEWAVAHALLLPVEWDVLTISREVSRALVERQQVDLRYEAPLAPTAPVDRGEVERSSAAAAAGWLDVVTGLLEHIEGNPVPMLKAGGVGVRELRRMAKLLSTDEEVITLALELAAAADLLAGPYGTVVVGPPYEQWRAEPPGQRAAVLVAAWWFLPYGPTGRTDPGTGKALAPLMRGYAEDRAVALRHGLLRALAELPVDRCTADAAQLATQVRWQRPLAYPPEPAQGDCEPAWLEAVTLGLVAAGAATPLGRAAAALAEDRTAWLAHLGEVCAQVLPNASSTVTLQADLTAVVSGPPSGALTQLLDAAATREVRGSASVWRFSTASVRGWLDAGRSAEELLAQLEDVAPRGVPQPLAYLIGDVARRHGHLSVAPVTCCITSEDGALLAEVAASRALRSLGLRLLAPTVLASRRPATQTLAALRDAGYAPVAVDADGSPVLERSTRLIAPEPGQPSRRLSDVVDLSHFTRPAPAADPDDLARRLLAAPQASPQPPSPKLGAQGPRKPMELVTTQLVLREYAVELPPPDLAALAHAVDHGLPVHVAYENAQGRLSERTLSNLELDPPFLLAWCHLRQDERTFTLERLLSVQPS